jgi:primosomal protein N'
MQQQIHERHFAQLPPFGKLASVAIAADTLTEVQKAMVGDSDLAENG